uniref:Mediator of RNA polymerase II transcription subunit 8 n=2 Tax=Hirondellea gigas TaxID=1518452 RepID=A0A2P2I2C1_9CRUS
MQREERVLEVAIDAVQQRVVELKQSLLQLLQMLEQEGDSADWPHYLQQYSVISAQMFTLLKVLRNEKTPALRNYLTLPLQLNAEPDDTLLRSTENRVPAFSHDFVPNLLRTKPDPDLELKYHQLQVKMNIVNSDTSSKQINLHNKVVKHIVEVVSNARDEWETETASRSSLPQTCSINETHTLLAALGTGKGLRPTPITSPMGGAAALTPQQQQNANNKRTQQHQTGMGKAPSSIKTNIKAANQTHPYNR